MITGNQSDYDEVKAAARLEESYREMGYDCGDLAAPLTLDQVRWAAMKCEFVRTGGNTLATAKNLGIARDTFCNMRKALLRATRNLTHVTVALVLLHPLISSGQIKGSALPALAQLPPPPTDLAVVVPVTNRPVTVTFNGFPLERMYATNSLTTVTQVLANSVTTNMGMVTVSNATQITTLLSVYPLAPVTNFLITATAGPRARESAFTNLTGVVTNRSLVMWISPTNQYVFTIWLLLADGQKLFSEQADWPAGPSNQVRFVWSLLFSDRLEKPTHQWTQGGQTYSFTLTNGVNMGTNRFVRAIGTAVLDDFTPKSVVFDQATFGIFTNSPQQ